MKQDFLAHEIEQAFQSMEYPGDDSIPNKFNSLVLINLKLLSHRE